MLKRAPTAPVDDEKSKRKEKSDKGLPVIKSTSALVSHRPSSTRESVASFLHPNAYRQHRQLEDALHLVVTRSGIPSSVLVGETSLALASNNSWLGHLVGGDLLDRVRYDLT